MDHYTFLMVLNYSFLADVTQAGQNFQLFNGLNIDVTVQSHRVGNIAKITSRPRNQQDKASSHLSWPQL